MVKTKGLVGLIMGYLGFKTERFYVRHADKSHYVLVDGAGNKYYLIVTSRVLRYPKGINIDYDGYMFGINRNDLYDISRDGDFIYIVWAYKKYDGVSVYVAPVKHVLDYVKMYGRYEETTCRRVRGSEEYVCHYPLDMCKLIGIIRQKSLIEFLGGSGDASRGD